MVYSEYVNHMFKSFYAHIAPDEITPVSQTNRAVCSRVIAEVSDQQQDILRRVYSGLGKNVSMTEAVKNCAEQVGWNYGDVWRIVKTVSKRIARERGLID